jgi:hypothetical protein
MRMNRELRLLVARLSRRPHGLIAGAIQFPTVNIQEVVRSITHATPLEERPVPDNERRRRRA